MESQLAPDFNHPPVKSPMEGKLGVCVTFHGKQRKSTGSLKAEDQVFMLEQSIERLLRVESYPVIISGILASPCNFEPRAAKDTMLRLWRKHHWVTTTEDFPHQQGAFQTILNGFEAAYAMGLEWLFVTAEDILFEHPNPVRKTYEAAIQQAVDYYGRPWLDDVGILAVSTQVFLCRIRSLFDPERNWFPWQQEFFRGGYRGIEHYTLQTLKAHNVPYHRDPNFTYFHTHDIGKFRRFLNA